MVNAAAQGGFVEFAAVSELASAAETGAAVALLSQYLTQLPDDQLLHAVRYFAGQAQPARERPASPIGEVTLLSAFSILTGTEPAALAAEYKQIGDLAELAALVLVRRTHPVLTLEDVAIALEQLAKTRSKRRLGWVIRLLERATAPEAKCLTRLMLGNLQMDLSEQTVERALAQVTAQPLEQIEWAHILLGDLGKTAVLARHDQLEQARMQLFHPLKFMLASSVSEPLQVIQGWMASPTGAPAGFAVETKYDGLRVQAHIAPADRSSDLLEETVVAGIRVALFSRSLAEITTNFPDLISPLAALEPRALVSGETAGLILDGEIVPYQADQLLPFAALQPRLDSPGSAAAVPVAFIAYDLLYKDGEILLNRPYQQRRAALEALAMETPTVRLASAQVLNRLEELTARLRARAAGEEGLMVKALQSCYRPGRHSQGWLKLKRMPATLDVVVTAVESTPDESDDSLRPSYSIFSIAVRASQTDPTLLNIGKVSVGLEAAQRMALSDWVEQHTVEAFAEGRVCLVEPQIVLEVGFERLARSVHHQSGYALEQPRIIRIRDDKPLSEIDSLASLAVLAVERSS